MKSVYIPMFLGFLESALILMQTDIAASRLRTLPIWYNRALECPETPAVRSTRTSLSSVWGRSYESASHFKCARHQRL
jgi:hypothetical protein